MYCLQKIALVYNDIRIFLFFRIAQPGRLNIRLFQYQYNE